MSIDIKHSQIFDSANRMFLLKSIFEELPIANEDKHLIAFLLKGNTAGKDPLLKNILNKTYLPRVDIKEYDKERLKKWLKILADYLKGLDDYGIADFDKKEIVRLSKNGKYTNIYGLKLDYLIYRDLINMLENKPDYALSVIFGIGRFFEMLQEFLSLEYE